MAEANEPDVESHLRALDEEIARLRKLEAALDRKLAEREGSASEGAAAPPSTERD